MMIKALIDGTLDTMFSILWKNVSQHLKWMTEEIQTPLLNGPQFVSVAKLLVHLV